VLVVGSLALATSSLALARTLAGARKGRSLALARDARWRSQVGSLRLATSSLRLATSSLTLARGSLALATSSLTLANGSLALAKGSLTLAMGSLRLATDSLLRQIRMDLLRPDPVGQLFCGHGFPRCVCGDKRSVRFRDSHCGR
jgi:hypothetical protein